MRSDRHQGFDPTGLIPIQHDPPSRHQGICSGQNGIAAPCCDHLLRPPPRQGWTSQPLKANLMEGLQHKVRTLQVSSEPPAQASPQPKSLFIQPLARFQLPPQPPDLQHPLHPLTDTSNQSQALPALALALPAQNRANAADLLQDHPDSLRVEAETPIAPRSVGWELPCQLLDFPPFAVNHPKVGAAPTDERDAHEPQGAERQAGAELRIEHHRPRFVASLKSVTNDVQHGFASHQGYLEVAITLVMNGASCSGYASRPGNTRALER